MPVLYGVFLYMGTAPLAEMHFFDRLRIVFMPAKYQPDFNYLRKVPLKRVHMYTAIQLVCFAILWVVKTNETISISFPLMVSSYIFLFSGHILFDHHEAQSFFLWFISW